MHRSGYACLLIVCLVLAARSFGQTAAVKQQPLGGANAFNNSSIIGWNNISAGESGHHMFTWYQRRRLQQTAFTQLRPMSDTTRCVHVPGANYTNGNQLVLAPCAAVPEQNISLPAAGDTLFMYIGPVAAAKVVDLYSYNTTSGAPVTVSGVSKANWRTTQGQHATASMLPAYREAGATLEPVSHKMTAGVMLIMRRPCM
jgi:hypothetical protein